MSIVEFLLARFAEDEARAHAAAASDAPPWSTDPDWPGLVVAVEPPDGGLYRGGDGLWDNEGCSGLSMVPETATHVATWNPARVLAECEAKRAILDLHRVGVPVYDAEGNYEHLSGSACGEHRTLGRRSYCSTCSTYCYSEDGCPGCMNPATSDTLNALAFVYRDHPDWREEWRP